MKEHITIKEAANILGVSPQTLRNWEKYGQLVPYRNPINNYRVYRAEQIRAFLEDMHNERLKKGRFRIKVVHVKD